jgi:hypothetical protein
MNIKANFGAGKICFYACGFSTTARERLGNAAQGSF